MNGVKWDCFIQILQTMLQEQFFSIWHTQTYYATLKQLLSSHRVMCLTSTNFHTDILSSFKFKPPSNQNFNMGQIKTFCKTTKIASQGQIQDFSWGGGVHS